MENKTGTYPGFDLLKFVLAVFVACRHIVQIFFDQGSRWRLIMCGWLSNLSVPVFFTIASFLLFEKYKKSNGDGRTVGKYILRILRMYVVWSAIYLPIDMYNWSQGSAPLSECLKDYLRHFFLDSSIPQLWYLTALALALALVYGMEKAGAGAAALPLGLLLFAVGVVADNWAFNQRLPQALGDLVHSYRVVFFTERNGIFYGMFFVALGKFISDKKIKLPFAAAAFGSAVCLALMFFEAMAFSETNFVFSTAPAAFFFFQAAAGLKLPESGIYAFFRSMSLWIYLLHYYFFYILVWLSHIFVFPSGKKEIAAMILVPLFAVSALLSTAAVRKSGLVKFIT